MIVDGGFVVDPAAGGGRAQPLSWEGDAFGGAGGDGASLDASGGMVLPGLVCGYVELGAAFVPGFPQAPGRVLDAMDEEALFAAARLSAMNAVLAGATTVFDVWRGALTDGALDVIARAVSEVGLRAVLSCTVTDTRRAALSETLRFAKARTGPVGVGMAIGAGTEAVLLEAAAEARRGEMPTLVDVDAPGTVTRVARKGGLRAGCIAVLGEGVEIGDEERALLRDLQTWVVLRPRDGAAPHLRGIGSRAVLGGRGSDAALLEERAALAASARDHVAAPSVESLPAERAMRAARGADPRAAGARAVSFAALTTHGHALASEVFDRPFGRYGADSPVDLVVLDAPLPAPVTDKTFDEHLDRLETRHVRHVIVGGEVVVRDRKPTKVDEAEVRAKAREALAKTWAKAAGS